MIAQIVVMTSLLLSASTTDADLGDRVVPARPALALVFPAEHVRVMAVIEQALRAARIPSGIEHAPHGWEPEVVGIAPPERIVFNGRSVRDILDQFVSIDPRYAWSEIDGRIIIRPRSIRGPDGFLQKRLPNIVIRRAVMDDAMSTFAEAAFNRDHAYMPIFFGRGEVREEHWVSVNLKSPSVLDALNAISAAAGALSWRVTY